MPAGLFAFPISLIDIFFSHSSKWFLSTLLEMKFSLISWFYSLVYPRKLCLIYYLFLPASSNLPSIYFFIFSYQIFIFSRTFVVRKKKKPPSTFNLCFFPHLSVLLSFYHLFFPSPFTAPQKQLVIQNYLGKFQFYVFLFCLSFHCGCD